jgi:hypothetical protein
VKLTETLQLAPAATLLPQLLTAAKSPEAAMLVTVSTSTPVLVSDTRCAGAVVLIVCDANVNADGKIPIPDASVVNAAGRAWIRDAETDAAVVAVEIVNVDVAPAAPGVTVGGSNAHVVCGGRLPLEQLSATGEL